MITNTLRPQTCVLLIDDDAVIDQSSCELLSKTQPLFLRREFTLKGLPI